MKRSARKILALLLAVLVLFPNVRVFATEEDGAAVPEPGDYAFSSGTITGLKKEYLDGLSEEERQNICLKIPAEIAGTPVTSIGSNAFNPEHYENAAKPKDCIYTLDFSGADNLVTIKSQAFFKCETQGELVLPDTLEIIEQNGFSLGNPGKSGFTGVLRLPSSLTTIGTAAFSYQEGITSVIFPDDCQITELTSAFRYCKGLTGTLYLPKLTLYSSSFQQTSLETVYLAKGAVVNGSNTFAECNNLTSVICADEEDFNSVKSAVNSSTKTKVCYPVEVTLLDESGSTVGQLERLHGRPLNFVKQNDGCWSADPDFTLPILDASDGYEVKWSFSKTSIKGVSGSSLVDGDTLYAVTTYLNPEITYSDGIDKVYDGTPSELSVNASHPLYSPMTEATEGSVLFYYWWGWAEIGKDVYDQDACGWDNNTYDVGGIRSPYGAQCFVQVQAYVVENLKTKLYYTSERHYFPVMLYQGTPDVAAQYSQEPLPLDAGLPALTAQSSVPGSIAWDDGQVLQLGGGTYTWTFTPEDTTNYETVSGTAYLYAYDGSAPTSDVVDSLLPELPPEGADLTPQQQEDILAAKLLAESSQEPVPQETLDALNEALSQLPQVDVQVDSAAVSIPNEAALLENMTGEQARALFASSGDQTKYQITLTVQPQEPTEEESAAVTAALNGCTPVPGHQVTVKEILTAGGESNQRELNELRRPVTLVFPVPEELTASNRTFYVVRTHAAPSGALEAVLLGDEDQNPDTVTVTSDLFSYYALAYQDQGGPGGDDEEDPGPGNTGEDDTDDNSSDDSGGNSGTGSSKVDRPQPQPADSLTDIGGHWAEKEIRTAVNAGIFHGVTETQFGPEVTMSRAMFVTGLYRVAGSPAPAAPSAFSDVSSGAWYADAVRWAGAENIVSGFGNGLFQPDGTLTREQIASFLYRDAQRRGLPMHQAGDLTSFQDGGQVSPWARDAVAWAVGSGLISGKTGGLLAPSASATRAEAATMFCRYLSLLDRNPAN